MKILVTGFDPFGGEKINPALEAVKRLSPKISGSEVISLEIPTVFFRSLERIEKAIEEHHPDVVLSIGQAGGRSELTIERIGINVDDARIPDNAGNQSIDTAIFKEGPDAYFANLPIKAMVENIKSRGIPASVSNTAGTFVCNHVLYGIRHLCTTQYPQIRSGFIHIPYLPEQVLDKKGVASMSLDTIIAGIEAAIEAIVVTKEDIKAIGGAEH